MNFQITTLLLALAGPVSMAAGQDRQETDAVTRKESATLETTLPVSRTPIMCLDNLKNPELARRTELVGGLRKDVAKAEPIAQGYQVSFRSENLAGLIEWIGLERRCCPFLTFDLVFPPDGGGVLLRIVGGDGVKEFLASTFFSSDPR